MSLALPLPRPTLPAWHPVAALRAWWSDRAAAIRAARIAEHGQRGLLDALAPDWIEHRPDGYVIGADGGEVWTRTLLVRDWPAHISTAWLAPLLFECGGDVSVALHSDRLATGAALRLLKTQRVLQTSVAQARAERGAISDPSEALDLASAEQIASAVAAGHESLFSASLAIALRAASRDALAELERAVRERLDAAGVTLAGMHWRHAAGFRTAGMPYAEDRLGQRRTLDTTTLALSFPFLSGPLGTPGGPLLGVALADKRPVFLDLWDTAAGWPAPHLVMCGSTGGGKTVTAATLLTGHLTQAEPPDVILIDPAKGDYRRLVRELGGQIVRLSTRPERVLNPFDLPPATTLSGTGDEAAQNPVLEQTRLATGLLALMVAEEGERLKKRERSLLETALLDAYAAHGIAADEPGSWTPDAEDVPVLRDVLAALEATGAHDLADRLRPYCTGTLAGLFDRPTNLTLGAGLTSFDLEGLDAELRPLAVWTIGNHVWKLARADRRRRIACLDEVKTLLEHPESARLVAHLYALGRAYGLSVWSMSQLLGDYAATQEGERAIQNASTVIALRQAPGKGVEDATARYGLSAEDGQWLTSCRRGQAILVTPNGHGRIDVRPPAWVLGAMGAGE